MALAAALFLWRGVARGVAESADLSVGYAAARAWMAGEDPYDPLTLMRHLSAGGAEDYAKPAVVDFMRNIYIPVTIPMFAPLGVLPWTAAKVIWVTVNLAGLAAIVVGASRLAGVQWDGMRGRALLVLALALAPVHTAISTGQTSIVSTALVVIAVLTERRNGIWAGVFYGLATAFKVQIALPFLAYALWRRQWAAGVTAGCVLAALLGTSLLRMSAADVDWMRSRETNVERTMADGGYNDAVRGSPGRYTLVNLQYLTHNFTDNRLAAHAVALGVTGVLGVVMVWRIRPSKGHDRHMLLALSLTACLTLLVSYHRTYDAVLMLMPAGWALAGLGNADAGRGDRARKWGVLLCSGSFVFPGQVLLQRLGAVGVIPVEVMDAAAWQSTAMAQHVWAILGCAGLLTWAALRDNC